MFEASMRWLWWTRRLDEHGREAFQEVNSVENKERNKPMARSLSIAMLGAALLLELGGVTTVRKHSAVNAQEKSSAVEVKIDNFSFGPTTVTVPVGTTVTWVNRDDIPHTVVSTDDPKAFKSKVLDTDEKFSFTFTKAGTYPYFCSVHPKMTAKVIVQ
jgi:plastocyanin